ncbi:MAG: rod shape-determining protein MreD [Pyrinomonadaceae bacterium]
MENLKITIAMIVAILLQWTLRNVAESAVYVNFVLIVVVYAALQRNSIRALLLGTIGGIAVDSLSGGLLGASGFSLTLVAFVVSEIARRVYLDNLLLRIPVIAGASILNNLVFFGMHRLLGQNLNAPLFETMAYSLIGTTIVGTFVYIILDSVSVGSVKKKRRDFFAPRRQTRRRNPIRLGRK